MSSFVITILVIGAVSFLVGVFVVRPIAVRYLQHKETLSLHNLQQAALEHKYYDPRKLNPDYVPGKELVNPYEDTAPMAKQTFVQVTEIPK